MAAPYQPICTTDDLASGLRALCALDPRLSDILTLAGDVPLRRRAPSLGRLMQIVISQQISVQSADAIWHRFEAAFDLKQPHLIEQASHENLQALGLSRPKIKTLRAIAGEAVHGGLQCEQFVGQPFEVVSNRLTAIHGVGPWTAEIFALFCLGHPDLFPANDIALQKSLAHAFMLDQRPKADEVTRIAEKWVPWRGVAARLFWAYFGTMQRRTSLPI